MDILLEFFQCPGDSLVASSSIASLQLTYPGKYRVGVFGAASESIYLHNPHVDLSLKSGQVVKMDNPLINETHLPWHFMHSYCKTLSKALGVDVPLRLNRPECYLSKEELSWKPRIEELTGERKPYWVVSQPGAKTDYTVKYWPHENMQAVVDAFKGKLLFVQVGEKHHRHKPYEGVINEIGKTDTRQLIRLVGHPLCRGVVTGESFPWHLAASFGKPAVCVAAGWLPRQWVNYPTGTLITRHGCLPCCRDNSCWKDRVVPLKPEGDEKNKRLCTLPVLNKYSEPVARCMDMIDPTEVILAMSNYIRGGVA